MGENLRRICTLPPAGMDSDAESVKITVKPYLYTATVIFAGRRAGININNEENRPFGAVFNFNG